MKLELIFLVTILTAALHAQESQTDPYRNSAADSPPRAPSVARPRTVEDKYRNPAAESEPQKESEPINMSVRYEVFSLPLQAAAALQREQPSDSKLYEKMVEAVGKETARQESLVVLRARSGQKATSENISEQIYPTEYDPAQTPNSFSGGATPPAADGTQSEQEVRTPAGPKSFETRNTGTTLEIEPTCSEDLSVVDLRLVPEHVTLVGRSKWGQEFSTAEMPEFETQRLNTAATMRFNQPFLLGTISRPPVSKVDPDSANRIWFAFVTVTLAKP